jgi:hypothetical protein
LAPPEAQRVAEEYETTNLIFALPTEPATAPALSFDFHASVELGLLVTNNENAKPVTPMSPSGSIEASDLDEWLEIVVDRSPYEKQSGPTESPLIPPQLSTSISNEIHSTRDGVDKMFSQGETTMSLGEPTLPAEAGASEAENILHSTEVNGAMDSITPEESKPTPMHITTESRQVSPVEALLAVRSPIDFRKEDQAPSTQVTDIQDSNQALENPIITDQIDASISSSLQVQTELDQLVPNSLVPVELEHISKEPDNVGSKLMIGLEPLPLRTRPDERFSRSPSTDEVDRNSTESAGEISSLSSEHSGTLSEQSRSPSIPQTLSSIVSPILDQRTIASPIPGLPWQALQRTSSQATISAPIPKIYLRLPAPVKTAPVPASTSQQLSAKPGSRKRRRKSPSTLVIVPPIQTSTPRSTSSIQSSAQSPKDKSQTSSPTLPVKIKLKFHEPPSPESPPPFKRRRKDLLNSIVKDESEPVIFDCIVVRNDFENVHYLLLDVR